MRIRLMSFALVAGVAFAVSGCGGAAESDGVANDVAGTVTFWDTSGSTVQAPTMQKLIGDFQTEYPNVRVEYTNMTQDEALQRYQEAAAAGNAPDVFRADASWTPNLAAAGYLEPLERTVLTENNTDFLPAAIANTEFVGQQWAVPQTMDAVGLMCNEELLTKAGVATPKSWIDVVNGIPAMQAVGATFLYGPTSGYFTLPYVYSHGGDLLDVEKRLILIDDENSVAGFQSALDLISLGAAVAPQGIDPYSDQQDQFKTGKVACIFNGSWAIGDILNGPAFGNPANLSISPIPAGTQAGASAVTGQNLVVYAGSNNKDASYALISFLTSVDSQTQLALASGLLPTRAGAYQAVGAAGTEGLGRFVLAFRPVMDAAVSLPQIPEVDGLFPALDEGWISMYTGRSGAAPAAAAVAGAWQQILPTDYVNPAPTPTTEVAPAPAAEVVPAPAP